MLPICVILLAIHVLLTVFALLSCVTWDELNSNRKEYESIFAENKVVKTEQIVRIHFLITLI